ncbi:alpha/beta hydrolase family protein [Dokdonella sp. MW10]|uniref:alpha/beta hydrolase family protein n=1 Tax=Dokdonella sp. MW10 TaxID=2992926 RepID=UPI003F7EAD5F
MIRYARAVAVLAAMLAGANATVAEEGPTPAVSRPCAVGSYAMADGTAFDIGPGAGQGELRWRRPDGRTGALAPAAEGGWTSTLGWTGKADGVSVDTTACASGRIVVDGVAGERIALREVDTRFRGSGIMLQGRLTMPPGERRVPIVVLVHGAERDSALERYALQRQFAAAGIGVFAYDKRGTGRSEGRYTQDYLTLATDLVAATREARRIAGGRAGRIAYQAGSQGGWVAPLAARIAPVDVVIVSFGLAVSPLDEDREAIAFDMQRAGHGPEVLAKAMQVADAIATIVRSGFREGYDTLAGIKTRYGREGWFADVRGNIAGYMLASTEATMRAEGPVLLAGVPADYDPMPVLAHLDVPQVWIFGGQDRDAPPFETLRRLASLQREGRPITTVLFQEADHGLYDFAIDANGERVSTRQPDGYFDLMVDAIHGRALAARYGAARIERAASHAGASRGR